MQERSRGSKRFELGDVPRDLLRGDGLPTRASIYQEDHTPAHWPPPTDAGVQRKPRSPRHGLIASQLGLPMQTRAPLHYPPDSWQTQAAADGDWPLEDYAADSGDQSAHVPAAHAEHGHYGFGEEGSYGEDSELQAALDLDNSQGLYDEQFGAYYAAPPIDLQLPPIAAQHEHDYAGYAQAYAEPWNEEELETARYVAQTAQRYHPTPAAPAGKYPFAQVARRSSQPSAAKWQAQQPIQRVATPSPAQLARNPHRVAANPYAAARAQTSSPSAGQPTGSAASGARPQRAQTTNTQAHNAPTRLNRNAPERLNQSASRQPAQQLDRTAQRRPAQSSVQRVPAQLSQSTAYQPPQQLDRTAQRRAQSPAQRAPAQLDQSAAYQPPQRLDQTAQRRPAQSSVHHAPAQLNQSAAYQPPQRLDQTAQRRAQSPAQLNRSAPGGFAQSSVHHAPAQLSRSVTAQRPALKRIAWDDEPITYPKPRSSGWLKALFFSLCIAGGAYAARDTIAPAFLTTPAPRPQPAPVAPPAPVVAEPPPPAPEAVAAPAPEAPAPASPQDDAKARRSAARAAIIAERWRERHAARRAQDEYDERDTSTREPEREPREPAHYTPKPAAQPEPGILRINSRPWSNIFVDGQPVGHTPQMNLQLPAGQHQITLINNDMQLRKAINVTIAPGGTTTQTVNLAE